MSYILFFLYIPIYLSIQIHLVPPKLAPLPSNAADEPLYVGDYFQLTCAVVHGDFPYNITWYFNGQPAQTVNGIQILIHGKRSSSLNIESVHGNHAGNYTCVGANRAGETEVSTTLSVKGWFSKFSIPNFAFYFQNLICLQFSFV